MNLSPTEILAIAVIVGSIICIVMYHYFNKTTEGYFKDPYPIGLAAFQCYKNAVKRGYPKYKMCDPGDTCNNMGYCCNSGKECSPTTNFSCNENYNIRTY